MSPELISFLIGLFLWVLGAIASGVCLAYIYIFNDEGNPFWSNRYSTKAPKVFQSIMFSVIVLTFGPIGLVFTFFGFLINLWEYLKKRDQLVRDRQTAESWQTITREIMGTSETTAGNPHLPPTPQPHPTVAPPEKEEAVHRFSLLDIK
jgi:magnesium-transporting ATPase (P-type)